MPFLFIYLYSSLCLSLTSKVSCLPSFKMKVEMRGVCVCVFIVVFVRRQWDTRCFFFPGLCWIILRSTLFQQMNKRSENHRNQDDSLTGSSALFTFLQNTLITPTMYREEPRCECQPQFLFFDSWGYFVFAFISSPFSETFMELRAQRCGLCRTQGTRRATAGPLQLGTTPLSMQFNYFYNYLLDVPQCCG